MDPQSRVPIPQQGISADIWETHKETIRGLYLTDGRKLPDVITIMEREYRFRATMQQYKKKLNAWKFEKSLSQRKIIPMIRKQDKRRQEGKETVFTFHNAPVSNEKLERSRKRFENELADPVLSSVLSTPSHVECMTPRSPSPANGASSPSATIGSVITSNDGNTPPFPGLNLGMDTHCLVVPIKRSTNQTTAEEAAPAVGTELAVKDTDSTTSVVQSVIPTQHPSFPIRSREMSVESQVHNMEIDSPPRTLASFEAVQEWLNIWSPSDIRNSGPCPQLSCESTVRSNTPGSGTTSGAATPSIIASSVEKPKTMDRLSPLDSSSTTSVGHSFQHIDISSSASIPASSGALQRSNAIKDMDTTRSPVTTVQPSEKSQQTSIWQIASAATDTAGLEEMTESKRQFFPELCSAQTLIRQLRGKTVALELAEACIRHSHMPFMDYLLLYREKLQSISNQDLDGVIADHHWTIAAFDISFEVLERQHPASANSLEICAFLRNENISFELISRGSDVSINEFIKLMRSYSLVRLHSTKGSFSIPPAIHAWLSLRLSIERREEKLWDAIQLIGQFVSSNDNDLGDANIWTSEMQALVHIETCWLHIQAHTEFFSSLGAKNNFDSRMEALGRMAGMFQRQGKWRHAEELYMKVIDTVKAVHGLEHPRALTNMNNLAKTYWSQGQYQEAERLQVLVMETRKRVLGTEHAHTLTSMNNLASTYWSQGRWAEAEKLEIYVMKTRKDVLGEDDPCTLTTMHNLASTHWSQGKLSEAEDLEANVMIKRKIILGEEHPHTLTSIHTLAGIYADLGRWKKAEELGVHVVKGFEKVLGKDHHSTLTSIQNLVSVYTHLSQWEKAEVLGVQLIEKFGRILGQQHPDTLTSGIAVAWIYHQQGRLKEAEDLAMHVIPQMNQVLGPDHPYSVNSIANLAYIYKAQDRLHLAIHTMTKATALFSRKLGEKHPYKLRLVRIKLCWNGRDNEIKDALGFRLRTSVLGVRRKFGGGR